MPRVARPSGAAEDCFYPARREAPNSSREAPRYSPGVARSPTRSRIPAIFPVCAVRSWTRSARLVSQADDGGIGRIGGRATVFRSGGLHLEDEFHQRIELVDMPREGGDGQIVAGSLDERCKAPAWHGQGDAALACARFHARKSRIVIVNGAPGAFHGIEPRPAWIERQTRLSDGQILHHLRLLGFPRRRLGRLRSRAPLLLQIQADGVLQITNGVSVVAQLNRRFTGARHGLVVAAVQPQCLLKLFERRLRLFIL